MKWLLMIGAALLLLYKEKPKRRAVEAVRMSGLRKRRANRLFYVYNGKTVTSAELLDVKALARQGRGSLYAVYAKSADQAREFIRQGRAERYR